MHLTELIDISRRVGSRIPHWTQGKGGNVSVKEGHRLWIKASGAHLGDLSASRGIAVVDLDQFGSIRRARPVEQDPEAWYAQALTTCAAEGTRPSMETGFHALLPRTWVMHFHSLAGIVMAHEQEARPELLAAFLHRQADTAVAFVPAEIPGWQLSLRLLDRAGADAIVLANHGVVLQGDEPRTVLEQWEGIERAFCREWHCAELVDFGARLTPGELAGQAFRAYFPDAVVFRDAIVAASRGGVGASSPASRDHRDALEMLEAIVLLERACPTLREIDAARCAAIATLPAEVFRRS